MGKPGFPIPSPGGRVREGKALPGEPFYPLADAGRRAAHPGPRPREKVWAGAALTQGMGKPGFPIPSPGGRVWEGKALPGEPFYPLADAGRRAAHPGPRPREGLGGLGLPGHQDTHTPARQRKAARRLGRYTVHPCPQMRYCERAIMFDGTESVIGALLCHSARICPSRAEFPGPSPAGDRSAARPCRSSARTSASGRRNR